MRALRLALTLACLNLPAAAEEFPLGQALSTPLRPFEGAEKTRFLQGANLFQRAWVLSPTRDPDEFAGLGPLYNRLSCIACHVKNGRGEAPEAGGPARFMVLRLSVEGADEHGEPKPHPVYGGQLNPDGALGVPGEGEVLVAYDTRKTALAGGDEVELRAPKISFRALAYGPLDGVKTSLRNAPPVAGLGLLAQVPEAALQQIAAENGGRLNHVFDRASGAKVFGRFGWKANQPSVAQQVANAFAEDLGVTSRLFPDENCTPAQKACAAFAARENAKELTDAQLEAITFYLEQLAPPRPRVSDDAKAGETIFANIGCAGCHRPRLPLAGGGVIAPYTDLALHDMGEGLSDGRQDYEAGPRDWRTAPLWGLGLAGRIGDTATFLHDGRARSFPEAILWHGGDADPAARAYAALPRDAREKLHAFLSSL